MDITEGNRCADDPECSATEIVMTERLLWFIHTGWNWGQHRDWDWYGSKQWVLVPVPVLELCEHFCIIYIRTH